MALHGEGIGAEISSFGVTPEAVRKELKQILASRHFSSSKRSQQFLQYVVEQTLQGNEDLIKERLIGVELFRRDRDYITGDDPIVRVQAGDVRRRLERYAADLHSEKGIQIDLPTGTYVPVFGLHSPPNIGEALTLQKTMENPVTLQDALTAIIEPKQDPSRISLTPVLAYPSLAIGQKPIPLDAAPIPKSKSHLNRFFLILLALAIGAIAGYMVPATQHLPAGVKQFWGPVLANPKPVVINLGKPFVYVPSRQMFDEYASHHPGKMETGIERHNQYLPLQKNDILKWGDLIAVSNSGPAVGGVRASLELTAFLGRFGKAFAVRFGDEGSFLELSDSPAVILGAQNNNWTTEMGRNFPFRISDNNAYQYIEEAGTDHIWRAEYSTAREAKDYGLITRQPVGATGHFLISIAGLQDVGTESATELVTNPEMLQKVIDTLPENWQNKNLQILVVTDAIGRKGGPPRVLAVHVW